MPMKFKEIHKKIFDILIENGGKSKTPDQIKEILGLKYSIIQKSCKNLYDSGILKRRAQKRKIRAQGREARYYWINKKMSIENFNVLCKYLFFMDLKSELGNRYLQSEIFQEMIHNTVREKVIEMFWDYAYNGNDDSTVEYIDAHIYNLVRLSPTALAFTLGLLTHPENINGDESILQQICIRFIKDAEEGFVLTDSYETMGTKINIMLHSSDKMQDTIEINASSSFNLKVFYEFLSKEKVETLRGIRSGLRYGQERNKLVPVIKSDKDLYYLKRKRKTKNEEKQS